MHYCRRQTDARQRVYEGTARAECKRGGLVMAYGRKAARGGYQES